jgi:ribosomal protein S18 acetylase RimI-like enzyme
VVEIRGAGPGDDAVLVALDEVTWSPRVTPAPRREAGTAFFDERLRPEQVRVAELEGEVAGYTILQQHPRMPSHEHVLVMNGLAVHPAHQGRGIGGRLVGAAQQEAVQRGIRKLTLRVLATNAVARHLYRRCGFEVEGVLRGEFHLGGQDVDDVLMAWWP